MTITDDIGQLVRAAFDACEWPEDTVCPEFLVERPKDESHGDWATNAALMLAKPAKMNPRAIAETLVAALPEHAAIAEVTIAGPGFINFTLADAWYRDQLRVIDHAGRCFGTHSRHDGSKCIVEFVSANPTGPLHVGHGRGAVYGDIVGNLLRAVGYDVTKEYYVNDAGVQMQTLGRSVLLRLRELDGSAVDFPEDCYQGTYITDLARSLSDEQRVHLAELDEAAQVAWCGEFAGTSILRGIRADLALCGIEHDSYFHETTLHESGAVAKGIDTLRAQGHIYDEEGAVWFRTTTFGDDKDRVLKKSDGSYTYFTADIAYHAQKMSRGAEYLVNILGADHGGYVGRMAAAMEGLGYRPDQLDLALTQLVNLVRDGEKVSMSTRRGEFETLRDLVDAVGKDVVRYFFCMRSHNAQLDFDLKLATSRSVDNPVYYIQYGHARICSLFDKAAEAGVCLPDQTESMSLEGLSLPEEIALVKFLGDYPSVVALAAKELAPHRITVYLHDLARRFQSYYAMGKRDERYRLLGQPEDVALAKLYLLKCVRIVLQNALDLLGLDAPERMERVEEPEAM